MYVPASMRSGMTVTSAPSSSGRPSTVISGVPAPLTRAPMAEAREERTQDEERGTHGLHEVVRRLAAVDGAGLDADLVTVGRRLHPGTEVAQHRDRGPDVAQHGHVPDDAAVRREQGGEE